MKPHRPIGVTILAAVAALIGLYQLYRAGIFMGWFKFDFVGKSIQFEDPQWGNVVWALVLAGIWFWVASGFWNVRAWAWQFGTFISLFTLIWAFFSILWGSSLEAETVPLLLAGGVFLYLNYSGVRDAFMESEMNRLTPEQRAALEQLQAANASAATKAALPPTTTPKGG